MLEPFILEQEVIPGILEKDWSEIEKKIEHVKPFARNIHIDLLDGNFAPNETFMDPIPFAKYTKDIVFELHMMVEDPLQYLEPFANVGFRRFIAHIEKMPDIAAFVAAAEDAGEVGLAVDTMTSVEGLFPYLEDIDVAFVMTVKAGFSHQQFLPEQLDKVRTLREKAAFLPIEIDGGVSDATIGEAKKAGATRFVSTGYIFNSNTPEEHFTLLQKAIR